MTTPRNLEIDKRVLQPVSLNKIEMSRWTFQIFFLFKGAGTGKRSPRRKGGGTFLFGNREAGFLRRGSLKVICRHRYRYRLNTPSEVINYHSVLVFLCMWCSVTYHHNTDADYDGECIHLGTHKKIQILYE